jgi:glycerol-3-phosphate dehydrogenase
VAGAAAGKVFGEVGALARKRGSDLDTFTGLAGAGDLVATVVAASSRNRRAGELLAQGVSALEIRAALGHTAEAVDSVPLLVQAAQREQVPAPALEALAALIEGRIAPESWAQAVTQPARPRRPLRAA